MKNKKRIILIVVAVVTILLIAAAFLSKPDTPANCLTAEEVAALRGQYPICRGVHPIISVKKVSLEECIELSESFVYAEATGEINRYGSYGYPFYEYALIVIKDTEGIFKKGDKITIAANAEYFEPYDPKLEKGMRVVVPVVRDSDVEGRTWYDREGMFYVTDDEYVISVFEEEAGNEKSGMKVDALLNELKK